MKTAISRYIIGCLLIISCKQSQNTYHAITKLDTLSNVIVTPSAKDYKSNLNIAFIDVKGDSSYERVVLEKIGNSLYRLGISELDQNVDSILFHKFGKPT